MKKLRKGILELAAVLLVCAPLVHIADMMY